VTTITATDLVKRFGTMFAVDHVNFEVEEGEFLVLVGPSGCGKTTTLRLLAGLEPATAGEIRFGDRVVNEIRPADRHVAMVFQDYAIFPHMTVYENIAYGLRARGAPRSVIKERVPQAAQMFRIQHLLQRKPRQLSGGERQRVALSRAMVRDAEVYLYDEPLSNLDAQLRHQARDDIMALHREKRKPTIYVTHDQSEAMTLGDRIAVMRSGRIQQIGTSTELYNQPSNLFVAYFIGAPSINLFDVTLRLEEESLYAVGAAFKLLLPTEYHPALREYVDKKLKLGMRPEDLLVPKKAPFPVNEHNSLKGVVTVIEPTATGCAVYLSTIPEPSLLAPSGVEKAEPQDYVATFKLRLPASYIGQEIPLAVNLQRIHLFDAETEQSLLYGMRDIRRRQ
jgi:multiple sugar transport system ATP-binding protein